MSCKILNRLSLVIFALVPALFGLVALFNNISGYAGTLEYAIKPMLAMENTYGNPSQTWRAIHSPTLALIAFNSIILTEALVAIFNSLGIIIMLKNLANDSKQFHFGKNFALAGSLLGICVWGIGFLVIAGEWFLAWQNAANPINTQLGGFLLMVPCLFCALLCSIYKPRIVI